MSEKNHGRLIAGLITLLLLIPLSIVGDAFAVGDSAATTNPGVMVPLYTYPGSTWSKVVEAKNDHPNVPIAAIVNPSSGPGWSKDSNYVGGIRNLKSADVIVLGYVSTSYTARDINLVKADIDRWSSWYPDIDGIFFDEQTNWPGGESYYKKVSDYAESKGLTFTVGNPGANSIDSYLDTVDVVLIYESPGLPALKNYQGWDGYSNGKLGMIPFGVGSMPADWIHDATKIIGWIYVTNDNLPNPWDSLPSYFDDLVSELDDGSTPTPSKPATPEYSLTVKSVDQNGNTINGMWAEIRQQDGQVIKTGFTPLIASLESSKYTVTASDYQKIVFDHWSAADNGVDGSSTNKITVDLTSDKSITAHYGNGAITTSKTPLSVVISADKVSASKGAKIAFSAAITGESSPYQWYVSFGDGQQSPYTSAKSQISHAYASSGTYKAIATVKDETGKTAVSEGIKITVSQESTEHYPLTVKSVDLSGNTINGMWTEIRQQDGQVIKTGFTPLTYTLTSGTEYTVAMGDYKNIVFSHWEGDDKSGSRQKTITSSQPATLTAYYSTGQEQKSPKEVSVTIKSVDLDGKTINGLWTVVEQQDGKVVKTGYTPLTYTATVGSSYDVFVANYKNYSFDHWDNGDTDSTRKLSVTSDTTVTAYYSTGQEQKSPKEVSVTIKSVDLSGNTINGMWAEIRQQDGQVIKTGFTPLTYTLTSGTEYTVAMGDYKNIVFSHWEGDDKSGSRQKTINLNSDTSMVAYYRE